MRPKKKRRTGQQQRLPSQDELLSEAAQTEIENLRSLEALQAAEEEVRKRAAVKRGGYTGPCIRYKTKQINGEGLVSPSPLCPAQITLLVGDYLQEKLESI